MVKITIDQKSVEVAEGTTVLQAAALLGIEIPSLCYRKGFSNHPSCMACMVKDARNGKMFPSCAMPVSDGMNIITDSADLFEIRKESIELLLSDHVGDCEAPCRVSCPAFMNIPLMNRLIAAGEFDKALKIVRQEIALPAILGYICPAPCEKACRRKPIDGPVSICLLKRSAAQLSTDCREDLIVPVIKSGKRVAIIGTGPAGLSAAFYLLRSGHDCVLFDKNEQAGGSLRYSISPEKLPSDVLDAEIENIRSMGATFTTGTEQSTESLNQGIYGCFDAIILATGNKELNPLDGFGIHVVDHGSFINKHSYETAFPGVFACGNVLREQSMAVRAAAQGRMTAESVDIYLLSGKADYRKTRFNSAFGHLLESENAEYLKESVPGKQIVPVAGFMRGFTPEEARLEAQRCLHCDCRKPVSCKLRLYADEYQANRKRFGGSHRKQLVKAFQHEDVVYEPEKCIKCGLCVEITSREKAAFGMAFIGRGFDLQITVPFSRTVKEALDKTAAGCVEACPTGALAFKLSEETD